MTALEINSTFKNRYKILENLSFSSNKEVYLVKDLKTRSLKILKQYKIKPSNIELIFQWSFYNIPNVNNVYADKDFFIIENYIEGSTLISANNINESDFKRYLINIAEALLFIHNFDVNHGDIKPRNIIIGNDNIAYLIDYDTLNYNNNFEIYGITPEYTAPEILLEKQNLNTKTDIYSYGKTFLEIYKNHDLSNKRLLSIIKKTCQFNAEDRYNNFLEILDLLKRL